MAIGCQGHDLATAQGGGQPTGLRAAVCSHGYALWVQLQSTGQAEGGVRQGKDALGQRAIRAGEDTAKLVPIPEGIPLRVQDSCLVWKGVSLAEASQGERRASWSLPEGEKVKMTGSLPTGGIIKVRSYGEGVPMDEFHCIGGQASVPKEGQRGVRHRESAAGDRRFPSVPG